MDEQKPRLSVLVPAYNEADRISNTLLAIDKYLSEQEYAYEILVVIDGAKDSTEQVVRSFESTIKNLRTISNAQNHGKGFVVRQGMLEAKGEWRLFMDADGATPISYVEDMWPLADGGHKVIISSRDSKDAAGARQVVKQPLLKRILGNVANILIQIFGVWGIWDTQNGFKMFHEDAADRIFSAARIDRWGFDIEALALARRFGYRIGIIGVQWKNDPRSHVTLKSYVNTFLELLKIRFNLIRGVYGS